MCFYGILEKKKPHLNLARGMLDASHIETLLKIKAVRLYGHTADIPARAAVFATAELLDAIIGFASKPVRIIKPRRQAAKSKLAKRLSVSQRCSARMRLGMDSLLVMDETSWYTASFNWLPLSCLRGAILWRNIVSWRAATRSMGILSKEQQERVDLLKAARGVCKQWRDIADDYKRRHRQ